MISHCRQQLKLASKAGISVCRETSTTCFMLDVTVVLECKHDTYSLPILMFGYYGRPVCCTAYTMMLQETEDAYGRYVSLNVICHETSHQWFGDLITLEDFGEYTANEGVTSFMEYKCMQALEPTFLIQPLRHLSTSPSGKRGQ